MTIEVLERNKIYFCVFLTLKPRTLIMDNAMQTLTINIKNEALSEKVLWMLEHFKDDGLEISSKEDIEDLKLLQSTRNDERVSFENYLKNED